MISISNGASTATRIPPQMTLVVSPTSLIFRTSSWLPIVLQQQEQLQVQRRPRLLTPSRITSACSHGGQADQVHGSKEHSTQTTVTIRKVRPSHSELSLARWIHQAIHTQQRSVVTIRQVRSSAIQPS